MPRKKKPPWKWSDEAYNANARGLEAAMQDSKEVWDDGPRLHRRPFMQQPDPLCGMKVNGRGWPSDERPFFAKQLVHHVENVDQEVRTRVHGKRIKVDPVNAGSIQSYRRTKGGSHMTGTVFPTSDYPSYDSPERLLKDLRAQKFEIEDIADGWRITSPYTGGQKVQHRTHVSPAAVADLRDMGFVPPSKYKGMKRCGDCGERYYGVRKLTEHQVEKHGKVLTCKFCDFTTTSMDAMHGHVGKAHPKSDRKAMRRQAAQVATAPAPKPETPVAAVATAPRPAGPKRTRHKAEPVRNGYVPELQPFMEATVTIIDAVKELQNIHKELYAQAQIDRKRLSKIEEKLGKVLDAL